MSGYLQLNTASCKDCYKCIRYCPVKSISFSDHQAQIVEDECILCGKCYVICPRKVKTIRNDIPVVKAAIASKQKVYASVAPSFVANYENTNISSMEATLQKLGFFAAEETAIGAAIVKSHYERMIANREQRVIISSCCHSVNTLIQKYYPDALPSLAKVLSPMQAHCLKIKQKNPGAFTVFIGPCISKKEEAEQYPGIVDCVLTFQELSNWLAEESMGLKHVSLPEENGRSRLFPVAGGIIRSLSHHDKDFNYVSVDGMNHCIETLKDVIEGKISNCFIEMSACVGSCVGGAAINKEQRAPIRDYLAVNAYAGQKDFYLPKTNVFHLEKAFPFIGLQHQPPDEEVLVEILRKMGKTELEHELNCGSCGYNTCREKAFAIHQGKADITMCLPFLKEKAESFSDTIVSNTPDGIIVLNENLEIQQINASACTILNVKEKSDMVGKPVASILPSSNYLWVKEKEENIYNKKSFLVQHNKFIKETIIYDRNYHIIISIMSDVTPEEIQRSKKEKLTKHTIEIADKVVEKQMRVVQEIASLLGETTAETKVVLNSLKETLNDD